MKPKKEGFNMEILKRLGIFLAVCALMAGVLLLYSWLRGDTEPREPTKAVEFAYYAMWAILVIVIWRATKWVMSGKK